MHDTHTAQIQAEALAAYPYETAWLITDDGACQQVRNVHPDPRNAFSVPKAEMAAAQSRGLTAIVHSHPDYPACPSEQDMQAQLATAVPWGIAATDGTNVSLVTWWGAGVPRAPLEDRGFVHGVTDCYALIRDYYAETYGIDLIEVPRGWEWWRQGGDLYQQMFGQAGFARIPHSDAQPGDVWLTQIRSDVLNHGGILLDHGRALHHPMARAGGPVQPQARSRIEPIHRWLPHIATDRGGVILRYIG